MCCGVIMGYKGSVKHWHLSVRSDQVFRCVTEASQNMQSHNENQDNLKGGVQKLDYTLSHSKPKKTKKITGPED